MHFFFTNKDFTFCLHIHINVKQTIVKETANAKDTGLSCSDVLCLFSAEKGQRSVGRDPIPTCIRPYVPASKKQQGVANLDRIVVLP